MTATQVFPRRLECEHVLGQLIAVDSEMSAALYEATDHHAAHRQDGRQVGYLTLRAADSVVEFHPELPAGDWRPLESGVK